MIGVRADLNTAVVGWEGLKGRQTWLPFLFNGCVCFTYGHKIPAFTPSVCCDLPPCKTTAIRRGRWLCTRDPSGIWCREQTSLHSWFICKKSSLSALIRAAVKEDGARLKRQRHLYPCAEACHLPISTQVCANDKNVRARVSAPASLGGNICCRVSGTTCRTPSRSRWLTSSLNWSTVCADLNCKREDQRREKQLSY